MSLLSNVSIKVKILVIPAIAVVGFLASLAVNYQINAENTKRLAQIQDLYFPVVQSSRENLVRLSRIEELLNAAVSTGEADMVDTARNSYGDLMSRIQEQRQLWPEKKNALDTLEKEVKSYFDVAIRLSDGMVQGNLNPSEIPTLVKQMNERLTKTRKDLTAFNESALKAFSDTVEESNSATSSALYTTITLSAISIAVIILISASIVMLIVNNLNTMLESLKDIASGEGDLTKRIQQNSKDEIGDLVHWFNQFMDKLHTSINEVVKSIAPLANVSNDLGEMTNKTSQITDEQSRATDEVTRSVEDMFRSVQNVAQNASSAAEAAQDADSEAKSGRSIVTQSVEGINDLASEVERAAEVISKLEADTENVGTILDVIKAIAEQTNLLALNAAIEAARAGEQGRGFAVVADEVRTLASRTQDSTQEIQRVIEELQTAARSAAEVMSHSQEQARTSVEQAAKTDSSLATIAERVGSITQMNMEIASATNEQERVSNDIRNNVDGIRSNAEAAVKNVSEVGQASEALMEISKNLRTITGQFKV
ncbi:methyl-accepting chemotaxis protein [Bermanella marisrubri]|uniref:Methyl-accepting chemotaxis protein n=1 Tax=Bermanella marisrubri TaxID=207949 RepID=Q1N4M0_9GAMM|nr:methyl-accepting chemotaxis protein [Bermanella marisrubri]EAT13408.1 Methyl-accepting chemotaxis protein [Oceanobacter sp. RED65] [Bermanella marisrubri]QIZ84158.1 methyl-accepting chemotaxis protein [Bermanella marisrubri]